MFTWSALETSFLEAKDEFEREHVTPHMWRNPDKFGLKRFEMAGIKPGLRFSVDYPEDLTLVEKLIHYQEASGEFLGIREISDLLANDPDLIEINARVVKNEGLIKSALAATNSKILIGDREYSRFGVVLEDQKDLHVLIQWAAQVGINVWHSRGGFDPREIFGEGAVNHLVWLPETLPPNWQIVSDEGSWRERLIGLYQSDSSRGILLRSKDHRSLAEMLMFLFHTRFVK
jgi:hypothetical protein